MKSFLIVLLLVSTSIVNGQDIYNYAESDRIALAVPANQTATTSTIAAYINSHLKTDKEKVRAAYVWVASNISYSSDSLQRIILMEDHDLLVTKSLRRKKGVCENFAAIFNDICKQCGLHSYVVEGYTKQNGFVDKTAHAWCVVLINNIWKLYDPTWDAGIAGNFGAPENMSYFETSPDIFIETHMPFDPVFQLLNYPLSYKEFNDGSISKNKNYFNFNDSLTAYENSNHLAEYTSSVDRIQNNGVLNKMTDAKVKQLKMEIEIINQDKDSALYNDAVTNYNKAIHTFNDFIIYRNNQFKPVKTESEVERMFTEIERNIVSAKSLLTDLNKSKAVLALDSGDIEYALNNLSAHVKEQRDFFKSYLDTAKSK